MAVSPFLAPHQGKNNKYTQAFLNQNGPGDARPTAMQIVEDNGCIGIMKDKVFVLTGSSGGVGLETGRALAATGGRVFLGMRDTEKGKTLCKDYLEPGRVELLQLDVGSLDSVRTAARTILSQTSFVNVPINNAGIMACPEAKTADGFESQLAINYLGHFLLYKLLEPALLKGSSSSFQSRVVNVSSAGHHMGTIHFENLNLTNEYDPWVSYGQAKTATIYMTNEIERRYGSKGLHGLSLMPGGIATKLQRYIPDEQKAAWSEGEAVKRFWKSTAQGAATSLVAAVGKEWEGKGGVYLEDCQEAIPMPEGGMMSIGITPHAFDPEKETKLWDQTLTMLKL